MPKDSNTINNGSPFQRKIGKDTYSLFDVDNMRQANKELEKQMHYYERRAEALRDELKTQKEIDKLNEKEKRERAAKQRDLDFYASKLDSINDKIVKNDDVMKNWNKHIRGTFINPANSTQNANDIIGIVQSNNQHPKNFQDILNKSFQTKVNDVYKKVAANTYNKYKRQGADFTDSKVVNKMYAEAQEKTATKVDGIYKKYNTATSILKVAADTFNKAVNTWVTVATSGLNNQYNAFENSFENISVRNGVTRQNYYDTQWRLNNTLGDMGLRNNIATSEIQNMWNAMANAGVTIDMSTEQRRADITARAIDNVLTNKIVPYLDTTTTQWEQLINAQPELQKNIRGINRLNSDIVGNNYITQDLLQNILDDLQPIADSATMDLAMEASGATAFLNSAMKSVDDGGLGLDESTAKSLWTQLYKQRYYGSEILRSGSVSEKYAYTNILAQDEYDLFNSADTPEILGMNLGSVGSLANIGPGYKSNQSGLQQSILNDAWGINPALSAYTDRDDLAQRIDEFVEAGNAAQESMEKYANLATQDFTSDKNQTQTTLQDITLENFMNELAVGKQGLGHWTDIIVTAIKGLGTILISSVIGKGIGALAGSSAGGTGAGILASAGGISLGAFGAAAGMVASGFIADGIIQAKAKNMGKNVDYYDSTGEFNQFLKTDENGNIIELSDAAKELYSYGLDTAGSKGWGGIIADGFNFVGEYKANPLMGWGVSREDRNQAIFENQVNLIGATGLDGKDTAKAILAWLMIADASGVIEDIEGWSSDKIKEAYANVYDSDADAAHWVDWIQDWGNFYNPQISTDAGKTTTYITPKDFTNYHRQGLDYVPYDNYPAILHEGEAVLTATTANTLRDLLGEYQASNSQAVNYDSAMQTQTNSLVAKLDELITVVANNGGSLFTTSEDTKKAQSILNNSMRHMTSTKDF